MTRSAILLLFAVACTLPAHTAEIHVPGHQRTIQAGIDAAQPGDEVVVADGVWTGEDNRDLDFGGKAITVRSANGSDVCTIDCAGSGFDHHRAVSFINGEGESSVLRGFTITGGFADTGGAIFCDGTSPALDDNVINGNTAQTRGGGIYCVNGASPRISGSRINGNRVLTESSAVYGGGGLYLHYQSSAVLVETLIERNEAWFGGGIHARAGCNLRLDDCQLLGNLAQAGGGICTAAFSDLTITNCLISGNTSRGSGGAIYMHSEAGSEPDQALALIRNTTISDNYAEWNGGAIYSWQFDEVTIENSILWGDEPFELYCRGPLDVDWSDVEGGAAGEGNLDLDPKFVHGPLGAYYLSQVDAGQLVDSPCIDAGGTTISGLMGTTRIDSVPDTGVVDLGFHHQRYSPQPLLVCGPGPGATNPPLVRQYLPEDDAAVSGQFTAYGIDKYGVGVSCGDVDGDGLDEVITGAGPGAVFGPHVRGFRTTGVQLPGLSFLAYGTPRWGVNTTCGNIAGDVRCEIVTGAGPGAVFGSHVRAFAYADGSAVTPVPGVSFFAYGTPRWGVNVAGGDIDGDGWHEIITGAGPGAVFGPHVRGWNVDDGPAAAIPAVSFMAYGTPRFGVRVGCGDLDGDGIDEIVTAPGPSPVFGAHIRGWNFDGGSIQPLPGLSFFAWPAGEAGYGATVHAGTDLDGDGRDDLLVGAGPDPGLGTPLRAFHFDGTSVTSWFSITAYDPGLTHGVNVAAGQF